MSIEQYDDFTVEDNGYTSLSEISRERQRQRQTNRYPPADQYLAAFHESNVSLFPPRSRSDQSIQVEKFIKCYKRLRLCFIVLCAVNFLLIAFYIMTNTNIGGVLFDKTEELRKSPEGRNSFVNNEMPKNSIKDNFRLCTRCEPLVAKFGDIEVIKNIRFDDYPGFCCFQRIDQLLELFEVYAKRYIKQTVQEGPSKPVIPSGFPGRNELTVLSLQKPVAHLYLLNEISESASDSKEEPALSWLSTGLKIIMKNGLRLVNKRSLQIPRSGYYFVYCHLQFETASNHILMLNHHRKTLQIKLLENDHVSGAARTSSTLQGLFLLAANDTLTIHASKKNINIEGRKNYFGIFMV